MARFPYYKRNVKELGKLLARAAMDDDFKASLQKDPSKLLSKAGLPEQTTELMTFNVIDEKRHPNAKALPFRLNREKLESGNSAYLEGLSKSFSLN